MAMNDECTGYTDAVIVLCGSSEIEKPEAIEYKYRAGETPLNCSLQRGWVYPATLSDGCICVAVLVSSVVAIIRSIATSQGLVHPYSFSSFC